MLRCLVGPWRRTCHVLRRLPRITRAPQEMGRLQALGECLRGVFSRALLSSFFVGEASPTKIDYRTKGTLILTSLLEDLDAF